MTKAPLSPQYLPRVDRRPEGMSDHDYVAAERAKGPVGVDRYGLFWVYSHADMLAAADPRTTRQVETEKLALRGLTTGPIYEYYANSLLFSNGDAHQRRRRPLARAFAHKAMAELRPRIRSVAERLITPHLGEETDVLAQVAGPLPAGIVVEVLGAPAEDAPRLASMVYPAMRALGLRASDDLARSEKSLAALDDYVEDLLAKRRAAPEDDFLSTFVETANDDELTAEEARVQITSVILAGSDTMRLALCSTLAQLLLHPEQWRAFVADPEGLKSAVAAEGLRYDPPIGSIPRVATEDVEIGGALIPKDALIAPIVIAALRDPDVYADPDRFDFMRTDHPRWHPVFGAGAHRCLGEALARIELEEALAAFATLAPDAAMIGQPPTLNGVSGARTIDRMVARL